ncbi:MAG: MarR family transcriptional regulator [Acidimicrobiia bacterium]|nr:MarR family transcriptional regulator [Acidimicrobiia bacterium]
MAFEFPSDASVLHLLRTTHRSAARLLQARIDPHGVTLGMWYFLRVLWEEDGLTQRELSQRVGTVEPTTVTAINAMVARGLVRREANPADRRKRHIHLTEEGRWLRATLLPHAAEVNRIASRGIPDADMARLRTALAAMRRNVDQAGP